jgi:undecaprenol kinase
MLSFNRLTKSFKFAVRGVRSLIRKEQNFRIHLIVSLVVIMFAVYFQIKVWQWCLIVLMIGFVLILEMLNTVFERLVDILKPRLHDYVKEVKDIMSGIVLVAAVTSVIIALLIFVPYF